MKNMVKFLGIIAFAAVIVFSMIGCDEDDKGDTYFIVTFDLDGGKIGDSAANVTKTIKSGKTVSDFPTPIKDGFDFGNWWTEKNGGGIQFTTSTKVTSNRIVYAKWISNNEPGDDSINFSDAKWSNIDVYNSDGSALYNGSDKTLTKVRGIIFGDEGESFSAISNNPAAWNVKIINKKLSIALGFPDKAAHSSLIPDSINPDGLKVVFFMMFEDDNDNYISLHDSTSDKQILFTYADKAGMISGSIDYGEGSSVMSYNLNLKTGWNTVIHTANTGTFTTGVPDSNFKWIYSGDKGGDVQNPFIGTWISNETVLRGGAVYAGDVYLIYNFTDIEWEMKDDKNAWSPFGGTYTWSNNTANLYMVEYFGNEIVSIITIDGDVLSAYSTIEDQTIVFKKYAEDDDYDSIDFSDPKWSNIDVLKHTFDMVNQVSNFNPYNSSDITFTKVFELGVSTKTFSEVSNNPSAWNNKIENNKLSIALGNPDKTSHSPLIPDSFNPDGLKVVITYGFSDDNGNYINLIDPDKYTYVLFVYSDKAGIVSGNADPYSFNLNLKAGWNTVIYTPSENTAALTTGVSDSNYKWVFIEPYSEPSEPSEPRTYYYYYFSMLYGTFDTWNVPGKKTLDRIFTDGAGKNYSAWKSETGYTFYKDWNLTEEFLGTDEVSGGDSFYTDRPGDNWYAGINDVTIDGSSYTLNQFAESGLSSFNNSYYFAHHTGDNEAIIVNFIHNGGRNMSENPLAYYLVPGTGGAFPIGKWILNDDDILTFTSTTITFDRSYSYELQQADYSMTNDVFILSNNNYISYTPTSEDIAKLATFNETSFRGSRPWISATSTIEVKVKRDEWFYNITDNPTMTPFVSNDTIIGTWLVCDFTSNPNTYNPLNPESPSANTWEGIQFLSDGMVKNRSNWNNTWVNGGIWTTITNTYVGSKITNILTGGIIDQSRTAPEFVIKEYNQELYLFAQWKSGDYSIRASEPSFYVFKKEK